MLPQFNSVTGAGPLLPSAEVPTFVTILATNSTLVCR